MKRAFYSILVIGILIATTFSFLGESDDIDDTGREIKVSSETRSGRSPYDYDNIYIRGDDDLIEYVEDNDCEGNGTEEDPYIIRDLEIDLGGSYHYERGITIKEISLNLFLVNLTLRNAYTGLNIEECSNIAIYDSNISNCQNGIEIDSSNGNIEIHGIVVIGSDHGIEIYESQDISISDSTFIKCNFGIYAVSDSSMIYISRCAYKQSHQGIYMVNIADSIVDNCTIKNCKYSGAYIKDCLNIRMEWSEIFGCYENGVTVDNSHNVTFTRSSFMNNTNSGISVRYTDRFHVYYTEFWATSLELQTYSMNGKDIRIRDNTINGKPLIFKMNEDLTSWKKPDDVGQLLLFYCNNINITGGHFLNIGSPIHIYYCQNVSIKGLISSSNTRSGLEVFGSSDIRVENCIATNNEGFGLYIESSENIKIKDCLFSDNYGGLSLSGTRLNAEIDQSTIKSDHSSLYSTHSGSLNLTNCTIESKGKDGVYLERPQDLRLENNSFIRSGLEIPYPINGKILTSNNTVNGKSLVYLKDRDMDNHTLEIDPGQVILHDVKNLILDSLNIGESYYGIMGYRTENIIIRNSTINGCRKGLQIYYSNTLIIENSSVSNCGKGIHLISGSEIRISNTTFDSNANWEEYSLYYGFSVKNGDGLTLSSIKGSSVESCTFIDNLVGIRIEYDNECEIVNCTLINGESGITIGYHSNDCRITDNTIIDSMKQGIGIMYSGCEIWRNRLIGCSFRVYPSSTNIFDARLSDNNTVNDLPILYRYKGEMSADGTLKMGQYIAIDCSVVSISNLSMVGGTNSITVAYSDQVSILNCHFTGDGESIWLQGNTKMNLSGNIFYITQVGINITSSDITNLDWFISWNLFNLCSYGLCLDPGYLRNHRFNIFKNIFYECNNAALFYSYDECDFSNNDIIGSTGPVFETYTRTPYIYSNNFFYNNGSGMRWEDGKYQGIDLHGSSNYLSLYDPRDEYKRGNYWSDSDWLDTNRDGIVDEPLVVDIQSDGTEIVDSKPLTEPVNSAHITLHSNISRDMIRLYWDLPEYDFLGDLESVTLIMMEEGSDPVTVDTFDPDTTWYSFENPGDMKKYVFVAVPNFDSGQGYWSNPATIIHDNSTPAVRITSPGNWDIFTTSRPEILFTWELTGLDPSFVHFRVRIDDREWQDVGNDTEWGKDDYFDYYWHYRWDYGWHQFQVQGTDYLGRTFNDSVKVVIDYYGPEIEFLNTEQYKNIQKKYLDVYWKVEDEFLDVKNVSIRVDGRPWINVTGLNNTRVEGLEEGHHKIYLNAYDVAGNYNERNIDIHVEYYITPISIISPREGDFFNSREIEILWETGNSDWVQESYMSLDGGPFFVITKDGQRFQVFDSEGNHTITIKAANTAGEEFVDTVNFTIDTIAPSVKHYYPLGDNVPIDTPIYVEFSEEMNRSSVEIYVNLWSGPPIWDGDRAYFNRPKEFQYGQEVWVEVMGKDIAGNSLEPFSYVFTITDKGEVRGRVVDEMFNPVKGALVVFENGQEIETASDGTFSIMVSDGSYRIIVEKEGFALTKGYAESRAGRTTNIGDLILRPEETPEEGSKDEGTMLISIIISILLVLIMIILVFVLVRKYRSLQYFEE